MADKSVLNCSIGGYAPPILVHINQQDKIYCCSRTNDLLHERIIFNPVFGPYPMIEHTYCLKINKRQLDL